MNFETVETRSQPILYVSRRSGMNLADIGRTMGEAFGVVGPFIGRARIAPAGPALAVYRDWDEKQGRMTIDVGLPVAEADLAKAEGDVMAGSSPGGKALKAIHRGPYAKLIETYRALLKHMKMAGIPMPAMTWEVYVNDPQNTPEADLITEIYMPVA